MGRMSFVTIINYTKSCKIWSAVVERCSRGQRGKPRVSKNKQTELVFSCICKRYSKRLQHYSKSSQTGLFPFEPPLRDWWPGQSFTIDPQELKYWLIAGLVITLFKMSVFMVKDMRSITHSTRRLRYSVSIATASHASEAAVKWLRVNALNMVYWLNNSL